MELFAEMASGIVTIITQRLPTSSGKSAVLRARVTPACTSWEVQAAASNCCKMLHIDMIHHILMTQPLNHSTRSLFPQNSVWPCRQCKSLPTFRTAASLRLARFPHRPWLDDCNSELLRLVWKTSTSPAKMRK